MAKQDSGGKRAIIVLLVGITMLGAGGYGFFQLTSYYEQRIADARRPPETIEVIVASRDLFQGISINEDDLFQVDIEEKFVTAGVFRSADHVIGRLPKDRILANEFIREERLADPKGGLGLNAVIPRGFRAISLNIDNAQAGGGFVQPDNYVDVIVTIPNPETGEMETNPVLDAVYVLAVNDQTGASERKDDDDVKGKARRKTKPSVTFAVTPEQAEQLAAAAAEGSLQILIRNGLDLGDEEAKQEGFSWESLAPKPVPVRTRPRPKPAEPEGLIIIRDRDITVER
jgi:pilus assembly protein CpaB